MATKATSSSSFDRPRHRGPVNGSASDVANRADMDRRCRGVATFDGCADTAAQLRRADVEAARPRAPELDTREEAAPEGGSASLGGSCNDREGDGAAVAAAAGDSASLGGSCSDADDVTGRSAPWPSGSFGMPGRSSHLKGTDPGVLNDDEDDSSVDAITATKWCELRV